MRALALLGLVGLTSGCSMLFGVQHGRGTRGGTETAFHMSAGTVKRDSLGVLWTSEMGYASAPRQEDGAFLYRTGLDAVAALGRLVIRGGPTFGVRAGSQYDPQYMQVGLRGSITPALWAKALPHSNGVALAGLSFYAAVDRLGQGTQADKATQTTHDVPGQVLFTIGVSIDMAALDIFSWRHDR